MLTRHDLINIAHAIEQVEADLGPKAGASSETNTSMVFVTHQMALMKIRLRLLGEANTNAIPKPTAVAKPAAKKVVKVVNSKTAPAVGKPSVAAAPAAAAVKVNP